MLAPTRRRRLLPGQPKSLVSPAAERKNIKNKKGNLYFQLLWGGRRQLVPAQSAGRERGGNKPSGCQGWVGLPRPAAAPTRLQGCQKGAGDGEIPLGSPHRTIKSIPCPAFPALTLLSACEAAPGAPQRHGFQIEASAHKAGHKSVGFPRNWDQRAPQKQGNPVQQHPSSCGMKYPEEKLIPEPGSGQGARMGDGGAA